MTIIPIDSSSFAPVGLTQLMRVIAQVRSAYSPHMIIMALSTLFVERQTLDREIRAALSVRFMNNVFETCIPRTASVPRAIAIGQAVNEAEIMSNAAQAYQRLAGEVRDWFGNKETKGSSLTAQ
jgi:cellulose biosynthesis protein BcsQ